MSLLTAAAIDIGKAVAKSIFKFWMKDSELGQDISSSLIDLVGVKTSDTLAQRKGNRQFEDLGDKISKDVFPLLKSENIHLDEGERRAVAIAVVETLNKSRLSTDLLLQKNLQPTQLEQYLHIVNPNMMRDFSGAGIFLYQRILHECCTYIVDISSRLPSFTEHTFAEVLEREDLISARVDQVLEELLKIRKQLDPTDESDRFEIEYRDAVARNLDILQLIGADVTLQNRRYNLSMAYISLSLARNTGSSSMRANSSSESCENEPTQEIVSVDTALASSRRLLIRGQAGSGKTTLLQWIAVRAATKTFEGQLMDWNNCIPFFIRLRHYAQGRFPKPEAFIDYTTPAIAGTMPEQWIHRILRSGRAIVLVDGVDEISASQREEVHIWLRDLIETYKDARFIVTSRPYAIEEGWMNHEDFADAILQEMELPETFLFIDHWHEAIKQELYIEEEKKELGPLRDHLKDRVIHTPALRNLATNPLLCAMLCALNRERKQQLPVNRLELYEACCSLLLELREKASRIDISDYPVLNYSQKRRFLEDLAYWMTKANLSEAERLVVDERFTQKLMNMPNMLPDTTGKAVRKLLVERSGIIREPVTGKIDFTHRTFQEFFAAQAAVNSRDIEELVANAHNDQWREVIILAVGLAPSQRLCEQFIEGLIKRGDEEREHRYQIHFIAVACLETAVELGPEVKAEVEKRLSQLVPPRNLTDAKALAQAGNLAVPYLKKKSGYSATVAAACVRTLTLINGDQALQVLESYTQDGRSLVVTELVRGWDYFERETYTQRIIVLLFKSRETIELQHISSLDGIQYCISVKSLSLENSKQLKDLSPLASMIQLSSFELTYGDNIKDVKPLSNLTQLTSLKLHGCHQIDDLSPIASLTQLRNLELMHLYQVSDLSPLANLTQLEKLLLLGLGQINDLGILALLAQLKSLYIGHTYQVFFPNLNLLTQLTRLQFDACWKLIDLSPIANLTQLTSLSIRHCQELADLSPIANLTQLTSLEIWSSDKLTDLSSLANLTQLTSLKLSFFKKSIDLSLLANLTQLTSLDLIFNEELTDLSLLANLMQLTSINLRGCKKLTDLSPLTNLKHLRSLVLSRDMDMLIIPARLRNKVFYS